MHTYNIKRPLELQEMFGADRLLIPVDAWFDYVESESNLADGGSRTGLLDPLARAFGIDLTVAAPLVFPVTFPDVSPAEWFSWWES